MNHGAIAVGVDSHRRGRNEIIGIRVVFFIFAFFGLLKAHRNRTAASHHGSKNKCLAQSNKSRTRADATKAMTATRRNSPAPAKLAAPPTGVSVAVLSSGALRACH